MKEEENVTIRKTYRIIGAWQKMNEFNKNGERI